jgi:UDP-N-acetylmuramoylalanine--D-glutamate ligase
MGIEKYSGKRILVMGLGKTGKALIEALTSASAVVSLYDARDIEWDDPKYFEKLTLMGVEAYVNGRMPDENGWDYIAMSPGVPIDLPLILDAQEVGTKITGDLELAFEFSGSDAESFVAITGTNGKTTTTALTAEIFKTAGIPSQATGNIGQPAVESVRSAKQNQVYITEVSSFQLESTQTFRPHLSAILNLTEDHINRHHNMETYVAMKLRIFENQIEDDYFIYNLDDELLGEYLQTVTCRAKKIPFSRVSEPELGVFLRDGTVIIRDEKGVEIPVVETSVLKIPGAHNVENALAATALAYFAGIPVQSIKESLENFRGVEHRMEYVSTLDSVRFVNDSKGTNPNASIKAIQALDTGIILIAGGYDKQSDFTEFVDEFGDKVKHLLLIGENAGQIVDALEDAGFEKFTRCEDMGECVRLGFEIAEPGDTVLLSPASASWDMYNCFEERGEHFKECVAGLDRGEAR